MTLFLLPNLLDQTLDHPAFFPSSVDEVVGQINGLIAESEKGARAYLKRFAFQQGKTFRDIPIVLLNEHTSEKEIDALLLPIKDGEKWALLSDAGLPCIADPGAKLVGRAQAEGIRVKAFMGPCAPILALLLSGFSGQAFTFHGYLPREDQPLTQILRNVERAADHSTQLFIEAPYRNLKLYEKLLAVLSNPLRLCIAWNLTGPDEQVVIKQIRDWKNGPPPLIDKVPAVFVISR